MKKKMDGNMVAVLYSPGWGAGWSTWNTDNRECLYDPDIVDLVLAKKMGKAKRLAEKKWPDGYWGGADDLEVTWIAENTAFIVREYDGNESIEYLDCVDYHMA